MTADVQGAKVEIIHRTVTPNTIILKRMIYALPTYNHDYINNSKY